MLPFTGTNLLIPMRKMRSFSTGLASCSSKRTNYKHKLPQLTDFSKGIKKAEDNKKPRKRQVVVKRLSDDIEGIWLENLNTENIKLYRKTSFGSFRLLNVSNLIKRLREIYPTEFGTKPQVDDYSFEESVLKVSPKEFGSESLEKESYKDSYSDSVSSTCDQKTDSNNKNAQPYLSEYVIKHLVEFPMLRNSENIFSEIASDEADDFGDVDSRMFPSVTRILSETVTDSRKLKLQQWKEQMIEKLGPAGFSKYEEDMLNEGSKLHSTLKTYLQVPDKNLVKVDPQILGCWKSLETLLPDISDVQFVEESIYHPVLMYKGIVDCVASYRGTPCVIEWKKSKKPKLNITDTHDAPLQLCAYLGALPWHKKVNIERGVVAVAYTDGSPANIFEMSLESCEVYWIEWLRRVQSYWLKRTPTIIQNES